MTAKRKPKNAHEAMKKAKFILEASRDTTGHCILWNWQEWGRCNTAMYLPAASGYDGTYTPLRMLCELAHGPRPCTNEPRGGRPPKPSHYAMCLCENCFEDCLQPAHVAWVTSERRQELLTERGMRAVGKRAGAKLDDSKVAAILASPERYSKLAAYYGVSVMTVSMIRRRMAWKHVPLPEGYDEAQCCIPGQIFREDAEL